jgi:ATP-dependent Clp protease adapter protein ClpS
MPSLTFAYEPFYRVILLYSGWADNNEKEMAYRVHKSVPIITFNNAKNIVQRARVEGRCIVVTVIKDDAVLYSGNLKAKGFDVMLDEA